MLFLKYYSNQVTHTFQPRATRGLSLISNRISFLRIQLGASGESYSNKNIFPIIVYLDFNRKFCSFFFLCSVWSRLGNAPRQLKAAIFLDGIYFITNLLSSGAGKFDIEQLFGITKDIEQAFSQGILYMMIGSAISNF